MDKSIAIAQGQISWQRPALLLVMSTLLLMTMGLQRLYAAPAEQNGMDSGELEWYGLVESRPTTTVEGSWQIGGRTFVVNAETTVDETAGQLAIDTCAEVDYRSTADGDIITKLSSTTDSECTADGAPDDDGSTDECDDSMEESDADSDEDAADPDVDDAETMTDTITLTTTTTMTDTHGSDDECGDDGDNDSDDTDNDGTAPHEQYGTIEQMPTGTLTGTWLIDGITYVATADTEFEQEHGDFAVGVLVEVEYFVVDGSNQLESIETKPAPGAGPTTRTGIVQSQGAVLVAATTANQIWQIGNVNYTLLPITQVDEQDGPLQVGALAEVNSYTATDGSEVATRVRTLNRNITLSETIFLPTVYR